MIIEEMILSIKKAKIIYILICTLFTVVFFLVSFLFRETTRIQAADENLRTVYDGKEYFFIYKDFEEDDGRVFYYSLDRLNDLKSFQHEAAENPYYNYYLQIDQALEVVDFKNNELFIKNYREGSDDNRFEMFGNTYFKAKSYYISENVFHKFVQNVSSGRLYENTDFIYNKEYVPVIVGHNYSFVFSVGDTFEGFYWNKKVDFKIIGFLEENQSMLSFRRGDIIYLDNYILAPCLDFKTDPGNLPDEVAQTEDERLMQETAYTSYLNFIITMSEGHEINDFINFYDNARIKYNIPDYYISGINMSAVKMLQLSNKEYYKSIKLLIFVIACFSFICLSIFLVLKALKNVNVYYIHMLMGAGIHKIYLMILSEALSIVLLCHLLSFFISKIVLGIYNMQLVLGSLILTFVAAIPSMILIKNFMEKDFLWRKE